MVDGVAHGERSPARAGQHEDSELLDSELLVSEILVSEILLLLSGPVWTGPVPHAMAESVHRARLCGCAAVCLPTAQQPGRPGPGPGLGAPQTSAH